MVGAMIEAFADEIQAILADENIALLAEDGALRLPTVYPHALPPADKGKPPLVPWVLVSLHEGEQPSATDPRRVTLHITNMIYDDRKDMQGYQDALMLTERICQKLYERSFVAERYEVVYPYQFAVIDDVRYPYFSAGLAIKVELPGMFPGQIKGGYAYA